MLAPPLNNVNVPHFLSHITTTVVGHASKRDCSRLRYTLGGVLGLLTPVLQCRKEVIGHIKAFTSQDYLKDNACVNKILHIPFHVDNPVYEVKVEEDYLSL